MYFVACLAIIILAAFAAAALKLHDDRVCREHVANLPSLKPIPPLGPLDEPLELDASDYDPAMKAAQYEMSTLVDRNP